MLYNLFRQIIAIKNPKLRIQMRNGSFWEKKIVHIFRNNGYNIADSESTHLN